MIKHVKMFARALQNFFLIPCFRIYCYSKGIRWRNDWVFRGLPLLRQKKKGQIQIGSRLFAVSKSTYNSIGVIQPVVISVGSPDAQIIIGDDVGMSGCSISALLKITIGNSVLIGSGALITDNDAHPVAPFNRRYAFEGIAAKEVRIEDNVFIGARAIILKGVCIGKNSVVGAGSVVCKNIPADSIAAGNPARVIGKVSEE